MEMIDVEAARNGWIEFITGCMYAGKTEELLRRLRRIGFAKKKYLSFRPKIDNRYSKTEIVSHNKNKVQTIVVSEAKEIFDYLEKYENEYGLPYAIAIDEVQFFDSEIIDLCEYEADKGIRVIVAGLNTDFRGEPFGVMKDLICRAEYVTKLNAICQVCGAIATRTQRIINGREASYNDEVILIGATESYEARCRQCHVVYDKPGILKKFK